MKKSLACEHKPYVWFEAVKAPVGSLDTSDTTNRASYAGVRKQALWSELASRP